MKALSICEKMMKAITDKDISYGQVYSVFENACNIETVYGLVTLLSREKEMAPMSVIIDDEKSINFKKLGLSRDMIFNFNQKGIYCDTRNIAIFLDDCSQWFSGMAAMQNTCLEKDMIENIATLEMGIAAFCKHNGISPIVDMLNEEIPELGLSTNKSYKKDKIIEFIKFRFINFIKAVLTGDMESIAWKTGSIIGFGPGLTPSMDDFISGIMISFVYLADYYKMDVDRVFEFNRRMISEGIGRTTRVSLEMLKYSANGETNQAVKALMLSILGCDDKKNIIGALKSTVNIGETSGSDMILGIYVGFKVMTNFKFRGEWFNESVRGCQERLLL